MGEAALGPAETSREIAEHARHGGGHGTKTREERIISIVEAGLLAVVALLAAWSGYSAAKYSTDSRLTVAAAATKRNAANTLELAALDARLGDGLVFNAWLGAHALGDPVAEEIALRRFRPTFRVAFDAWIATDPDHNLDAPPGPQSMAEYKQPEAERARKLKQESERMSKEGSEDGTTGDDYVRTTVYLASVLFIIGISTQFPVRGARYGLIGVGTVILVFSVIQLASLPTPS